MVAMTAGYRRIGVPPVVVAEFRGERPQGVAVLLDNSESMKLQDRRVSATDQVRVAIAVGMPLASTAAA